MRCRTMFILVMLLGLVMGFFASLAYCSTQLGMSDMASIKGGTSSSVCGIKGNSCLRLDPYPLTDADVGESYFFCTGGPTNEVKWCDWGGVNLHCQASPQANGCGWFKTGLVETDDEGKPIYGPYDWLQPYTGCSAMALSPNGSWCPGQ